MPGAQALRRRRGVEALAARHQREYGESEADGAPAAPRVLARAALILVLPVVVWCFLAVQRQQSAAADLSTWLVGFARSDITPNTSLWLSGFASRTRGPSPEEVASSSGTLAVRALALRPMERSPGPVVLVALDVIGADAAFSDHVFERLRSELGLERPCVRLCFSHTHSGPVVGDNLFPLAPEGEEHRRAVAAYAVALAQAIVDTVRRSLRQDGMTLSRARFGTGAGDLAVNRRQVREAEFDGSRRGETDDAVPVLWFERVDDASVVGGVFGYAAHATVVTSGYEYSADYPGYASAALEGEGGPGGTWLFVCGVGGDQNIYPRGGLADARRHGASLASHVLHVVRRRGAAVRGGGGASVSGIGAAHAFVPLPFRVRLSRRELRRLSRRRDAEPTARRMARRWLDTLESGDSRDAEMTPAVYARYPIAVWRVGAVRIAFLGGEPTVGFGAALRREAGVDWVVGYTDDVMGYVATEDVLIEGLREGSDRAAVYYGLPAAWDPAVERTIRAGLRDLAA